MWLCWLIDRGDTPIASSGGALDSSGTTISSSTGTDHGQRTGSAGFGTSVLGAPSTSATPKMQRQRDAYSTSRSPAHIRGRRGKAVRPGSTSELPAHSQRSGRAAVPVPWALRKTEGDMPISVAGAGRGQRS